MIGLEYIIAFAMATTNLFKKKVPTELVQYCTLGSVVALNVLNAVMFKGDIAMAGKEGFIAGLIATGLFVAGDAVRKIGASRLRRFYMQLWLSASLA